MRVELEDILSDIVLDVREFLAQKRQEGLPAESPEAVREMLQLALGKLDLVTRQEFEAQQRLLEDAVARLEALQRRLDDESGGEHVPGND
ncbi:MAG: accessory factor UbiK family protein [Gammaproteobacteria bacterium AqS3]|nr:accessory factor UbiK family protein [Gammaproteobacteria bacterium AqS3]